MGTLGFKFHCDLKIVKDLKLVEIVTIIVVHNVEDSYLLHNKLHEVQAPQLFNHTFGLSGPNVHSSILQARDHKKDI